MFVHLHPQRAQDCGDNSTVKKCLNFLSFEGIGCQVQRRWNGVKTKILQKCQKIRRHNIPTFQSHSQKYGMGWFENIHEVSLFFNFSLFSLFVLFYLDCEGGGAGRGGWDARCVSVSSCLVWCSTYPLFTKRKIRHSQWGFVNSWFLLRVISINISRMVVRELLGPCLRHCYGQVDLQNEPRSNLNMLIESPYVTSYFMAIVRFDLSVVISEIFAVELFMTLSLTFRIGKVTRRYANQTTFCVRNNNVCPIYRRLRDIHVWTSPCNRSWKCGRGWRFGWKLAGKRIIFDMSMFAR